MHMKIGVLQTRSTNMPRKEPLTREQKDEKNRKAVSILHCCNFLTMCFYYDALRCVDNNFTEGGLCGEKTNRERGGSPVQAGHDQRMDTGAFCFMCACFLICHITIATEDDE